METSELSKRTTSTVEISNQMEDLWRDMLKRVKCLTDEIKLLPKIREDNLEDPLTFKMSHLYGMVQSIPKSGNEDFPKSEAELYIRLLDDIIRDIDEMKLMEEGYKETVCTLEAEIKMLKQCFTDLCEISKGIDKELSKPMENDTELEDLVTLDIKFKELKGYFNVVINKLYPEEAVELKTVLSILEGTRGKENDEEGCWKEIPGEYSYSTSLLLQMGIIVQNNHMNNYYKLSNL